METQTEFGCKHLDVEWFYIEVYMQCSIPNAFTPDGDLVNDRFGGFAEAIGTFQIAVFSRWGAEVFRSEDLEMRWNGRMPNGELAPAGMYGYRAVWRPLAEDGVSFLQFREKVGTVTLIR